MERLGLGVLIAIVGCSARPAPDRVAPAAASTTVAAALPAPSASPSISVTPPPPPSSSVTGTVLGPPTVSVDEAERVLFLGQTPPEVTQACAMTKPDAEKIKCLLGRKYDGDAAALKLALQIFEHSGDVAGVEKEQMFDGGYRGMIKLVPELPVGKYRQHLAWVEEGTRDFDEVYSALKGAFTYPGPAFGGSREYRWKALTLRFFRSVKRTTPNGFAKNWSYAYNVDGSLLHSAVAVRELMVHEIFHLNDEVHGDWSSSALAGYQAEVIKKCGKSTTCLAPYAPNDTIVKGGTYYAFHADNGPWEYAAELAVRHYNEHRAVLRKEKLAKPFKCGPQPNGKAWKAFVDEFWNGVDLVPACQ